MKRILIIAAALLLMLSTSLRADAAEAELFSKEADQLENSLPEELRREMQKLGADSIEGIASDGPALDTALGYLSDLIADSASGPLSVMIVLLSVIVLSAVAEGYVTSLRYTDMKDIMGVAVGVFIAAVIAAPVAELAGGTVSVMSGVSKIMLIYIPIMAGVMAFSGHVIASSGYYAAVIGVSHLIAWLSSHILLPMLNLFLSLAVSSGICSGLHLNSLTELLSKWAKWLLAFAMSLFTAVIGLNGALSGAADSLSGRAARFTLSSLIPIIGSAISEAYNTIQGSLGLLRSGMGVFVIIAVILSFLPLLIRTMLWSLVIQVIRMSGEALGAVSSTKILNAFSSFLSMLTALIICAAVVFVISSAAMMRVGGAS